MNNRLAANSLETIVQLTPYQLLIGNYLHFNELKMHKIINNCAIDTFIND